MQLYTNVFPVTDGKVYNQTTNPGWYARLLWTNTTSSSGALAKALQAIIVYNNTPENLAPGQSFTFVQNPQAYKITFIGDTLGASNFDSMSVTSTTVGSFAYTNVGTISAAAKAGKLSITNITEPAQELTLTSSIPNAFSYVGQTGSSVVYDLTPYQLDEVGNIIQYGKDSGYTNTIVAPGASSANAIVLDYWGANTLGAGQWVTPTNPLVVTITGYTSNSAGGTPVSVGIQFTSNAAVGNTLQSANLGFYNITSIQLSRAVPGSLTVNAYGWNPANTVDASGVANSVLLAQLVAIGTVGGTSSGATPALIYTQSGQTYLGAATVSATNTVIYNQQNGQPTNAIALQTDFATAGWTTLPGGVGAIGQYYDLQIGEVAVPSNTAATDYISIGIDNNSAGVTSPFQLNYSVDEAGFTAGTKNNVTYGPSDQGNPINVGPGFRTEKGSKVASIGPSTVTLDLAKAVDTLAFQVGSATATTTSAHSYKLYGPYTVGQATNIANVSIGPVNGSVKLGAGSAYTVTGIGNLTATPSVTTAYQPVWLKNLTTTPLVVLDTQASPGSNLILIGSGYVNALSQQVQSSYNVSITPTSQGPVVQAEGNNKILIAGYYANQTAAAGNSFIQQLYAQAN